MRDYAAFLQNAKKVAGRIPRVGTLVLTHILIKSGEFLEF
jgi:hypothetical protein